MRAERFKVVSVLDEALDASHTERLRYAGTRDYDVIAHKMKPGGHPTIFHVREVPHGLWDEWVDAADSYSEKYKRAFMCGVELVENLSQRDGVALSRWAPATRNERSNSVIMSDDDLRLFSPSERQEIGSVVYLHSFLPLRTTAVFLLPSSLQEPLVSLVVRLADVSPPAAALMTNGAPLGDSTPSPAETETEREMADVDFGNPTAARAAIPISP